MSLLNAAITGVHGWVPDYILTNAELETMVDTNDEWIKSRTGIEERRILKKEGWALSDMCVEAVRGLLEKTNTSPEEIDMVILGTITSDMNFPDTANTVCDKLGMKNAFGYDINAACSGFIYSITTGAQFIRTGMYKKVIVIGGDQMSSIINYEDRATCIIFGDGAGAVLLEPTTEDVGFQDAVLRGDGSGRHYLHQKAGGSLHPLNAELLAAKEHKVFQDGRPVFKAAVTGMSTTVKEVLGRNGLEKEDVSWLVPYQANIRIIQSVSNMLDFPMEKVAVNIQKYGNTTAATIPLCLWEYESRLKKGDNIVLTGFGGGFTWGSVLLKWAYDSSEQS